MLAQYVKNKKHITNITLHYITFSILQIAIDDLGKVFAIEIDVISQRTSKKRIIYIALFAGYFRYFVLNLRTQIFEETVHVKVRTAHYLIVRIKYRNGDLLFIVIP